MFIGLDFNSKMRKLIRGTLAEVLDEHDVAAPSIDLCNQDSSAIRRNGQARPTPNASVKLADSPNCSRSQAKELQESFRPGRSKQWSYGDSEKCLTLPYYLAMP